MHAGSRSAERGASYFKGGSLYSGQLSVHSYEALAAARAHELGLSGRCLSAPRLVSLAGATHTLLLRLPAMRGRCSASAI